jgi:hypothetical protein
VWVLVDGTKVHGEITRETDRDCAQAVALPAPRCPIREVRSVARSAGATSSSLADLQYLPGKKSATWTVDVDHHTYAVSDPCR